jgi:hypothetical protein
VARDKRDQWDWLPENPDAVGHAGRSTGAGPDGTEFEDWDERLSAWEDGPEFEVWAICACGWTGTSYYVGALSVKDLGRAGVERALHLQEEFDQHAAEASAPGPSVTEDMNRAAVLLGELAVRPPRHALEVLREVRTVLDARTSEAVGAARRAGLSWEKVAEPLGVSRAAAYEKYRAMDPMRWDGKSERCGAAHPKDMTLCEGDPGAVEIELRDRSKVLACVHHGSRMYASAQDARVRPVGGPDGNHAGAALEVYHRAQGMKPFAFLADEGMGADR